MDNLRFPEKYPKMPFLTFNSLCHQKLQSSGYNPVDFEIRSLEICKSTSDEAEKHLKSYPYSIVLSMTQEEGRGRDGKTWISPIGGIWLSIGFNTQAKMIELSTNVIESVRDTLEKYLKCQIKEPNDIFVDGKKLCGVLVESRSSADHFERVIIGIGINVFNDIPEELSEIGTRMKDHCNPPSIPELASIITLDLLNNLSFLIKSDVSQ
ncbi:MAG: biotin--[acetyl-CoA-carboxylase] ligase [Candidatus Heimdallarchaeota archaeon]|nr:biotin--[acetyl-CoA-carboxylase] ligase [Candidatus Heimdallarchaeota archaeon]